MSDQYPTIPEWTPSQQKLFDAIGETVHMLDNMNSADMWPVFEWWWKWSRYTGRDRKL